MKQRALIDIDMILDTRYGVMKRMNPQIAETLIRDDKYRARNHDKFDRLTDGRIDQDTFDRLYREYSVETLAHAKMTDFVYALRRDILSFSIHHEKVSEIERLEFYINIHPYDLNDEEAELIRRCVARYLPPPADVHIVNTPPQDLSPEVVLNSYEMLAYYNHEDWLKHHMGKALIETPLQTTVLITPRISSSGVVPPPDKEIGDPFLCRSAILVKWIALTYVDTGVVCHNPFVFDWIANRQSSTET